MRPPGEIRLALRGATQELVAERGAASWRDAAQRAGVGFDQARETMKNMAQGPRAELQVVGYEKRAHSRRWVRLYAPREAAGSSTAFDTLDSTLRGWMKR